MSDAKDDVLFISRLVAECYPVLQELFKRNWEENEGKPLIDGEHNLLKRQKEGRKQGANSAKSPDVEAEKLSTWKDTDLFKALLWKGAHILKEGTDDRKDVLNLHALRNAAAHIPADLKSIEVLAKYLSERWKDEKNAWWDPCLEVVPRFLQRHSPDKAEVVQDCCLVSR